MDKPLIRDRFLEIAGRDKELSVIVVLFSAGFIIAPLMASVLLPLIVAAILTYLLGRFVDRVAECRWVNERWAFLLVYGAAMIIMASFLTIVLPSLVTQAGIIIDRIPELIDFSEGVLVSLSGKYPDLISRQMVTDIMASFSAPGLSQTGSVITLGYNSAKNVMSFTIYALLIPVILFFLLKDRGRIKGFIASSLPGCEARYKQIWRRIDQKIGGYIRGKILEIIIVGLFSFLVFSFIGLNYAILLAILTGVSVLVPFAGAMAVALPVFLVGYDQFGGEVMILYVMGAYGAIQILDGNLLNPILFSETVNMHPVTIISAVLIFGSLWGFWGVFFAVPIAAVIQSIIEEYSLKLNVKMTGQESIEAEV